MTAPCFHDGLRLVSTSSAINCSRLFVASTLTKWGARSTINNAVHVVDELVTAAVNATGIPEERMRWTELTRIEYITVRLLGFDASIRIEVWDSAPNPPFLPDETGSPIKRGCYPTPRGKVVWAELPVLPRHHMSSAYLYPSPGQQERCQIDLELMRRVRKGLEDL